MTQLSRTVATDASLSTSIPRVLAIAASVARWRVLLVRSTARTVVRVTKIKMVSTRGEFVLANEESGYEFRILTALDPERGWGAAVTFKTAGFKTEESAVGALRHSVQALLEMLDAVATEDKSQS